MQPILTSKFVVLLSRLPSSRITSVTIIPTLEGALSWGNVDIPSTGFSTLLDSMGQGSSPEQTWIP